MLKVFFLVFTSILIQQSALYAKDKADIDKHWKISDMAYQAILKGEILAEAQVDNDSGKKTQSFAMQGIVIHEKKCQRVLPKMAQYENYDEWIDYINHSTYDEKKQLWTVKADHVLLPYPMVVHIVIPRLNRVGVYDYYFPTGIFKGLKGKVHLEDFNGNCLLFAKSFWQGKDTGIPNVVIDVFAETLTQIGGKKLKRILK
jgi:hypothetical protein